MSRRKRPTVCYGTGLRVTPTGSSAFPEVRCSHCEAHLRPKRIGRRGLYEYVMRSHRPLGVWKERSL